MYLYISRLGTLPRLLQFFGGEIFPISIITYLLLNGGSIGLLFNISFVYFLILSFLAYVTFFTLYEMGYIMNDCISVKHESNPTLRFRYVKYWKYLICLKMAFFVIMTLFGYFVFNSHFLFYFPYGALVMFLFLFHNKLPNEDRGLSYFWLESTRLMMLPFLFLIDLNILLLGLLLLLPELIRRTIRYLRIKYVFAGRNFTFFDLKTSLVSILVVSLFLLVFKQDLVPGFLLAYGIIVIGILLSIYKVDKMYAPAVAAI